MKMNLKALSDTVNQEIKDLKLALAGMSDRMPDPIDAGCVVEQIQSLQNQLRFKEQYASRLAVAMKKQSKGEFGCCDDCGTDIPTERLQLLPDAPCCVDCQSIREYISRAA